MNIPEFESKIKLKRINPRMGLTDWRVNEFEDRSTEIT